jgi:RNA polymerase sigma-70 factor (ECF subfamily)
MVTTESRLPDDALIAGILGGNKRLFEVIIRRHNQRLYRIGMSVLGNETEVEDAMQTAYINAYRHLPQFERRAAFSTWLCRIMLHQCYEQKRKNNLMHRLPEAQDNLACMKTPENVLAGKELGAILERAIGSLPEKYRLVFVLREMEDMSVRETSEALGIEPSNVKVRLNRAKGMLREQLGGYMKNNVYAFHLVKCDRIAAYVMARLENG